MNVRKKNLGSAFKRVFTGVLCLALVLSMVPAVLATEAESELFDLDGSSMTLGNTLEINFAIDTAYLEADGNYAVISKEYADQRGTVTKTVPQSQWKLHSGTVEYFSYAVSAKEMNDKLTVTVYNAGGEQLSNPYEDSVAGYCLRMLGKEEEKAAPNKQIMSLFVDMLNYGAAAQAEWSYNTDALANAGLSETQKGYATVPGEASSCLEKGAGYYGTSLSLKENILMNFAYYADQIQDAAYAEVSFIDHYGNDESETIQAKDFKTYDAQIKYIEITSMAVADCRKSVTVTLYDADGNALSTTVDSAESYISRMSGDIYDTILAFSDGAHNYFHSEDADPGQGENTTVISGNVSTEDGKVTEDAAFSDGDVSAQVPAGVQVEGDTLTLTITEKASSDSGVELEDGQELLPLDIHIDGVSAENATPIQVCLGKILPQGLNIGNVTLYHVEDGVANAMSRVMTLAELDAHNEFYYDPVTGDITVAMASFSEVAMVSTESKWTGARDYTWYDANDEDGVYTIANADQLAGLSAIVGGMDDQTQDSFAGKTINLITDINLADKESENNSALIFYPIGYYNSDGTYEKTNTAITSGLRNFEGTFDGQGHTISNFYQNTWEMKGDHDWYAPEDQYYRDGMGLFGRVYGGTVKNLTVKNFSSDGEIATTGTIAAYADFGATFENIAIFDCNPRVYNIGNGGIVGCVGWYTKGETTDKVTFSNITVDNSNKISALWGSYDVACGGIVGQYYPTSGQSSANYPANPGIALNNCHVAAQMDVYNDVCANYQYYAYRYAGMLIGSIRENETIDGHVYPKMDGITADGCTVHFGDWNDYYYCELVANSLASYTHDHQMSRLEQVASVDAENMTVTPLEGETTAIPTSGRVNYVVVKAKDDEGMWIHGDGANYATCYHFVDGAVWNHADAGTETVDGVEGVLKEDKQLIYREFNQLFTGYGWGVTSKGLTDFEGVTNMDIKPGDHDESVEKFEATELSAVTTGQAITLGELFKATADCSVAIVPENIQVSITDLNEEDGLITAEFVPNISDWTQGTLTFTGTGAVRVTIQDYYFCTPVSINLTVEEPQSVTKFIPSEAGPFSTNTITIGSLFQYDNACGVVVDAATVSVTAVGSDNSEVATFTRNEADWTQGTLSFAGYTGEVTVTIQDGIRCNASTNTFTMETTDRFNAKLPEANFRYRVGNDSTTPVKLSSLFEAQAENIGTVDVAIENVAGNASGTYTANATWTNGTIQFSGTGVVEVTISDDNYSNPLTLDLEVVDAKNATTATSATANNVVLLNDCGFSSLEVSGGYTLYGNGFTLTCSSDSYAADLGYSFVTLSDGTLDNVQIVCPNFDYAALYKTNLTSDSRSYTTEAGKTYYYNARSGVMVSGNSQILNSRISGARAAVNAAGGNLVIENSQIELGAVANILVGAANSVTLRDVTLVQKPTESTYKADGVTGTTVMGFSVLFVCNGDGDAAPLTLEGELVQYAWIDESDAQYVPSAGQSVVETVLKQTDYLHDLDADGTSESLNLGFAYMPESLTSPVNATTITDNRTNKDTIPYDYAEVSILSGKTYVYSYKNTNGTDSSYTQENTYVPEKNSDIITVSYADTADGLTQAKSFSTSGWTYELNVDLDKLSGYALDFSKLSMAVNGVLVNDFTVNGSTKPTEPITVAAGGTTYTLSATIDGVAYTATFKVTGTETSKDAPQWSSDANGTALSTTMNASWGTGICVASSHGGTWSGAAPALENVYVRYWSVAEGAYKIIHLADVVTVSTGQLNGTNNTWTFTPVNGDFTLTLTGGQVHSSNSVNAMPVGVDADSDGTTELYFVAASSNGLVNTGNGARTIPVTYSFKDNNGGTELTGSHTWSVAENQNEQYKYSDFCNGTMTQLQASSGGCLTPDTLITLADGSQVRVDALTGEEELLVWNLETGSYDTAPIVFVDTDEEAEYEVVNLHFSDGSEVGVIYEHGFFDYDLGKYVYLDANNAESYIGHTFVTQGDIAGNTWNTATLTDVVIEKKVTTAYSPVTFSHLCYYTDGVLSMPGGIEGLFNIFDVDTSTMSYDAEKKAQDIETYGLYTYEDFADIITEEAFYAFNGAYLKVAIGKGMLTWEDIEYLAQRYVPLM